MSKHIDTSELDNSVNHKHISNFSPELLKRELTISFSSQGSKTPQGNWKTQTMSVEQLKTWLSEFDIGEKDGSAILQGAVKDGVRKNETIIHNNLLILDYDSGHDINEFVREIEKKGLAAILWTTHSHGVTETRVAKKSIVNLYSDDGTYNLNSIKEYFREQKGWNSTILDSLSIPATSLKKSSEYLIINHKPIPKFRVMFFLKDRFLFDDENVDRNAQLNLWKNYYQSFAKSFSIPFDTSCSDASRMMYTPRMPDGAKGHQIIYIGGNTLDITSYKSADINTPMTGSLKKKKSSNVRTLNLESFLERNSRRFEVVDLLEALTKT